MGKKAILIAFLTLMSFTLLVAGGAQDAGSAEYPSRDIDFLIGYSAGGGNDLITRAIAPPMEKLMGVSVVPSNLPGGSGSIAAKKIATEDPGYAMGLYSRSIVLIQYTGYGDFNIKSLDPVAQLVEDTAVLLVAADSSYRSIEDIFTYAKRNPGKLKVGNGGTGGLWHLAAALIAKEGGIKIEHIPYDGGRPALIATAAGEIDATITNLAEAESLVATGDLRMLAVLSSKRNPAFPDVPTVTEQGFKFEYPVWRGVFTAAGGAEEDINALAGYIEEATKDPKFVEFVENSGLQVSFKGPQEFGELIDKENAIYAELLDELGLKVSDPN
ncbi:tripartite tricarboxylate transporter substrate binding protein [Marispirochaeta aestuarii]|uniref:Bug family tripartite tricarboxylate transporter substrate binding protein n=1 Tax=Marispirochaeta aestuarii TaxID=1963862 RepID=UPI0029C69C25|nr:tripartite tricarboxylate transporter substrate binding protein [Marispirochaeta aestuarii]